jgi:hypothetical protein
MNMMIKTLMLATAATIGIGMVIPSSGSAASPRDYYSDRANAVHTYTPPEGQIDVRGFRYGRTPEQRARRDFQLEGTYPR